VENSNTEVRQTTINQCVEVVNLHKVKSWALLEDTEYKTVKNVLENIVRDIGALNG